MFLLLFFRILVLSATSFQLRHPSDIFKSLFKRILVHAGTAKLPCPISSGSNEFSCNFNEISPKGFHSAGLYLHGKTEATKPVIKVVR